MLEEKNGSQNLADSNDTAVAMRLQKQVSADGFPEPAEWNAPSGIHFHADWQGQNADAERATQVRLLWNPETLFLKFAMRFRTITVFEDSEPGGRRDQLWDRDVAEVFLQPESSDPLRYNEFEVSPNGMWLDLELCRGAKRGLRSGLLCRAVIENQAKTWTAELALPMKSLTPHFDRRMVWRVNFFRVEGPAEPRFYSAWRPTGTPQPNFHVPAAFGKLLFLAEP